MLDKRTNLVWIPSDEHSEVSYERAASLYSNSRATAAFFCLNRINETTWSVTFNFSPLPQPHPWGENHSVYLGFHDSPEEAKLFCESLEWSLRFTDLFEGFNPRFGDDRDST